MKTQIAVSTIVVFWMFLMTGEACGGVLGGQSDAGDGGDSSTDVVLVDSTGWTACTAPSGAAVCNGPNSCGCKGTCEPPGLQPPDAGALGICLYDGAGLGGLDPSLFCQECSDGFLCVEGNVDDGPGEFQLPDSCLHPDYAVLYANNGYSTKVRYADRATYTSSPLPTPSSCPSVSGLTLCGGACGSCPDGYVCMGRSPLHPYSLCVNDVSKAMPNDGKYCQRGNGCPAAGQPNSGPRGCLTFKVDDAAQPVADYNSLCVDLSICTSAAQGYPGGAFCSQ